MHNRGRKIVARIAWTFSWSIQVDMTHAKLDMEHMDFPTISPRCCMSQDIHGCLHCIVTKFKFYSFMKRATSKYSKAKALIIEFQKLLHFLHLITLLLRIYPEKNVGNSLYSWKYRGIFLLEKISLSYSAEFEKLK